VGVSAAERLSWRETTWIPAADGIADGEKAFGLIERYGFATVATVATVATDGEGGRWALGCRIRKGGRR
jgi:hypothetical protein